VELHGGVLVRDIDLKGLMGLLIAVALACAALVTLLRAERWGGSSSGLLAGPRRTLLGLVRVHFWEL
jgi:hypothetical protein